MARSRRRTINRQSGDAPRFSYATIAKWGLIALGTGGGTYGVFQVANMFPSGAAAVTDGTEVGPHLAETASASKPPLPDDEGTGFNNSPSIPQNRMANHLNPVDADNPATSLSNLTPRDLGPVSNGSESDLPPRPAGLPTGPNIPALPGNLGNNSLAPNLSDNRPSTLPAPLPETAPSKDPVSPSTKPAVANDSGPLGPTNPLTRESSATSMASSTPMSPLPISPLPVNPATTSSGRLAGGNPATDPSSGLPPSGLSPPRPIAFDANPLASIGATNPADGGSTGGDTTLPNPSPTPGLNSGSVPGAMPTLGPTGAPALLGGSPTSPSMPNPSMPNPSTPNPLAPAFAGSNGSLGSAPTGPPGATFGGANPAMPNPSDPSRGPIERTPSSNLSSLPNTRPTIGIPQEDRSASSSTLSPNPAGNPPVNPSTNPLTSPSSIPRSGSSSLPAADPLATDPRRTPATPANYPGQPNDASQPDRTPRENSTGPLGGNSMRMPASLVSNRPGDPQWEIQQQASLVIEKLSPPVVQVNVPAKFLMVVRNVGRVPAGQVLIRDRVPEKAQLLQATPKPTRQDGDLMEWELPALAAGDAFQIQLDLLPLESGEIGSVAQVTSSTVAATRTRSTRPQLSVQHTAAPQAMVGQNVMMNIVVRNDGDGVAENVILREIVPPQLMHPAGNEIENPLGTLAPGQTRTLQLPLVAKAPGTARNTIKVTGDGKLSSEHSIDIQIVAPQLQVSADGPDRRFLSRSATHTFQVTNNGTANATNVQMMARLPQGLRYDSSTPEGRYDPSRHAVFWTMAHLPSTTNQQVSLTTMPLAPGNQPIEFHALADLNQPQVTTKTLLVEQLSELFFDIDDLQDPIEVGTNTTYVIRVENQGSQVANDVAIVVDIPDGIEPLNVESPVEYQMQRDGQNYRLVLAPIANMNPRAQLVIRVEARGSREGDHRIEVRMTSAQRPTPVAKQESTKVYRDR